VINDVDYAVASNSIRLDDPGKDVVIGIISTFLENNFFAVAVRFASGTGPTGIQHLNESTTFQIVDLDDTIGTMEENESNEVMFRKIWDIARDRIEGRISWCEQSPFFVIGDAFQNIGIFSDLIAQVTEVLAETDEFGCDIFVYSL